MEMMEGLGHLESYLNMHRVVFCPKRLQPGVYALHVGLVVRMGAHPTCHTAPHGHHLDQISCIARQSARSKSHDQYSAAVEVCNQSLFTTISLVDG